MLNNREQINNHLNPLHHHSLDLRHRILPVLLAANLLHSLMPLPAILLHLPLAAPLHIRRLAHNHPMLQFYFHSRRSRTVLRLIRLRPLRLQALVAYQLCLVECSCLSLGSQIGRWYPTVIKKSR